MPATSSSKKASAEASNSKKAAEVTPLRISSRVRKEKFSVKELFGTGKDKDVSSDEEPTKPSPKKRIIDKSAASSSKSVNEKNSKAQVAKADSKASSSKTAGKSPVDNASKTGSSKTSVASRGGAAGSTKQSSVSSKTPLPSKQNVANVSKLSTSGTKLASQVSNVKSVTVAKPSSTTTKSNVPHSPKPTILQPNKSSGSKKPEVSSTTKDDDLRVSSSKSTSQSKDDKFDLNKMDDIKVEPIFNENNIDTVLENPGSLGLDIVVTKLSDSDQKDHSDSKKSKNVVTIAKLSGTSSASKPIKVVPLKSTDKNIDHEVTIDEFSSKLDLSGSSVVITPKIDKSSRASAGLDKKSKASNQSYGKVQIKEVRVNKTPGSDVSPPSEGKGLTSSKVVEKRKDSKSTESNQSKSKQNLIDMELGRCRNQLEISFVKTKDPQRQKAIKRSIMDVMSDVTTNGHKTVKVKSAEADSFSSEANLKKSRAMEEMLEEGDDTNQEGFSKTPYEFDRYFTTSESLIEHNDSLDSEASLEDNETYLSHFYEKGSYSSGSKRKSNDPCPDDYTIYDLMQEVNSQHPSWNLHVMQDTSSFLICQVERDSTGFPVITKMIELDSDFSSAKVYVNQTLHQEFNGPYNTSDGIKDLITSVQHL